MKANLNYYDNVRETKEYPSGGYYESSSTKLIRNIEIDGITEIDIFEKFYKLNNSLRYCNGSYYKFETKDWQDKYNEWLKSDDYKSKSFNLYYGEGGIVD
jgi:hypothetical protein